MVEGTEKSCFIENRLNRKHNEYIHVLVHPPNFVLKTK